MLNLSPTGIIGKMKGECRGLIDAQRVSNLAVLTKALSEIKWSCVPSTSLRHVTVIVECLILVYNWKGNVSTQIQKLRDMLYEAGLVTSSQCKNPSTMTAHLLSILAELVLMFTAGNAEGLLRGSFLLLLGISQKKKLFAKRISESQRVIHTVDLINFQVDLMHSYCSKYNPSHLQEMLRSILACLGVFAEESALKNFEAHTW